MRAVLIPERSTAANPLICIVSFQMEFSPEQIEGKICFTVALGIAWTYLFEGKNCLLSIIALEMLGHS